MPVASMEARIHGTIRHRTPQGWQVQQRGRVQRRADAAKDCSRCPSTCAAVPMRMAASKGYTHTRRRRLVHAAAASKQELPIFPLNVVALPGFYRPLQIFEARYRVLFNTLLSGLEGVEEGLVQADSPFCGTRKFGMCFVDSAGRLCNVGTILHIDQFAVLPDGRLYVNNKGLEKFSIVRVVKETPVLVCEIETLTDHDADKDTDEAKELAMEVLQLLKETAKLHNKVVYKKVVEDEDLDPFTMVDKDDPKEVSYFVALTFQENRLLQQLLLEESSTVARLTEEKRILSQSIKRYAAAAALSFLSTDSAESTDSSPPPSSLGPD